MTLIAAPESTLRLPLPVLRQQPLPLPSLPVENRLQEQDEPEETFVSFRRRAPLLYRPPSETIVTSSRVPIYTLCATAQLTIRYHRGPVR
jgi:hypothetical protein